MEPTFFRFIKTYSWRQQMILLVMTFASFPFLYASLELPKIIVNRAISAEGFPKTIYGLEFEHVQYLMVLSAIFLLFVLANGAFKYFINVFKGQLGERMLRRLRYQLFSQALRFPVPHFRRTSQGEIIAMITAEVEPLGGFIGDVIAQPAFQGGTLLTILGFMFAQDVALGLAAVALYPVQVWLIPKLQRQVNALAKERVRAVRRLAERIGETVTGIEEIHGNDTAEYHRADFARWVGIIYEIRLLIYRKKFLIKFLNNFIAQLTPFFFFSIGGYFVIKGDLTFGALVAVLSAYKDLSSPWKELLDWYQQKEDTRVKYEQLVEQFSPPGMLPEAQVPAAAEVPRLSGRLVATNLTVEDEVGVRTVDSANFQFEVGERVALVGGAGSGTDVVARLLARVLMPSAGQLCIGAHNLALLPQSVTGRRLAYVGQHVPMVNGSIRENLLYPLRNRPMAPATVSDEERRHALFEAERSGNTTSSPDDEWIDYGALGVAGPDELWARGLEVLCFVDLEPDIFSLGLRGTVDPATRSGVARRILEARRAVRERLKGERYAGLIEPFDRDRYNSNMSVAENVMFGLPVGSAFDLDRLGDHPYVQEVLERVHLRDDFFEMGLRVARIMVDLFRDLPPGHEFFERFSFIRSDDLAEYQSVIRRIDSAGVQQADPADRNLLSSLPFQLIPARHRLGLLDEALERRLLMARTAFSEGLPAKLRGAVAFFDPDAYNPVASVQDNILFGKLVYGRQQAQREIGALLAEVVEELGLRGEIVGLGLDFAVGIGGSRLSAAQRQKLAVGRALIKQPDLIVIDQAVAALDPSGQAEIMEKLLRRDGAAGLVWVMSDLQQAGAFDRVIVMEGGRVVRQGKPDDVLNTERAPSVPAEV